MRTRIETKWEKGATGWSFELDGLQSAVIYRERHLQPEPNKALS